IPSIVPQLSEPLLSYVGAVRFARNAQGYLQEGYRKYKGSVFRVPMFDRWVVVVCGAAMCEELRRYPEDKMSFYEAAHELVQTKYTITASLIQTPIHVPVIQGPLTRNLDVLLLDMISEIAIAIPKAIPVKGDEWVKLPGYATITQIVAQVSNRAFVGAPTCRNQEHLDIIINFTGGVAKARFILGFVPHFLKRFVGTVLPWSRNAMKRFKALIRNVVEQRQSELRKHGKDWTDKPCDLLTWLVEGAQETGGSTDLIAEALLVTNFLATHTSSSSLTHALYSLAANQQYLQPLREEVEAAVKTDGWTKAAINKLWRLDSFLKETQRLYGIGSVALIRKAIQDITLSDGTLIPTGTICAAAAFPLHHDKEYYADPDEFNPFRFSDMRASSEGNNVKHQYVNTSSEYIAFGHGKLACPGRFFASIELKAILAYLIINYDIKTEDGRRPKDHWFGTAIVPNTSAHVMFRKRQFGSTAVA
ncbi:cytochrome P450, partial [Wolfiporia cocos MD-104 SS10]